MLYAMFSDVRDAVECVLNSVPATTYGLDIWTDVKRLAKVVAVNVAKGFPFWEDVITPKGERHTVAWLKQVCAKGLERKNNRAVVSDSPTTMTSLRKAVVELAQHTKSAVGCAFHWVDKAAGDVQGKGPKEAESFVIKALNPTAANSLTSLAKSIIKLFHRGVPNGLLTLEREKENRTRRTEKARLVTTLRLQGDTRATGIATMLHSVALNRGVLRSVVADEKWDDFYNHLTGDDKKHVQGVVESIRNSAIMQSIEDYANLLTIMQVFQRVVEKRQKTLSDLALDTFECISRIQAFPPTATVTEEAKQCLVSAVQYRFGLSGYSTSVALLLVLDPRGSFNARNFELPSWFKDKYPYEMDAENFLKLYISKLPTQVQEKIIMQYGDLMLGNCFDLNDPDDARALKAANDMPLAQWFQLNARASCRELFIYVGAVLASIAITADGCEHGNSAYKWVQAGRVSLSDENARMIVYIIINTRMLALYKEAEGAERVVGGFRRCWGWPPAAAMAEEAYAELEAEPDTEVAALHANLVNNLAGLMPVDAPTDAAGPAARVGDKRPRTEEEPEEVE